MSLSTVVAKMDEMIVNGQIIEAVSAYFSDDATTKDFDGTVTTGKPLMLEKMNNFLGGIQKVNGITLHQSAVGNDVSMSEYTFDFDMKDGSKVLWHEIIRRLWKDGKVVNEQYFTN